MKDWVFWRIFRSVFLSLFALWLLLVGVLTFQNLDAKRDQVEHAMESYRGILPEKLPAGAGG